MYCTIVVLYYTDYATVQCLETDNTFWYRKIDTMFMQLFNLFKWGSDSAAIGKPAWCHQIK